MPHSLPQHTSASQLACYARCPRQYRYKYVEQREPESRSPNLAVGTAVHGAVAWWFETRKAGEEPPREEALKVFRADLAAALAAPEYRLEAKERAELFAEGERLVALFLEHLSDLEVVHVEQKFEKVLHDPDTGRQLPRPLLGYFDLVLVDGSVVELKTAARSYSKGDLLTNLQFAAYRLVSRMERRPDVRLVALLKTKTAKIQDVSLGPATELSERWFLRVIADIEQAIHAGVFPPTPGMSCSMCDFKAACFGIADEVAHDEAA